jgi:catechol O-methyltransferase
MASEPTTGAPSEQETSSKSSSEEKSVIFVKYPSLKKIMNLPDEEVVESHDGREAKLLKYIYNYPKLDSELRGSPTAILAVMDEFAAQEDFLINIGSDKAAILNNFIHEHKPKLLLELGTYVGYARQNDQLAARFFASLTDTK